MFKNKTMLGDITMNLIYKTESIVTPLCIKTHITYKLYLPMVCKKLIIEFSYNPKELDNAEESMKIIKKALKNYVNEEDMVYYKENLGNYLPLKNLITLSFDDKNGFRGCAHRQDNVQKLFISNKSASPGLIQGSIPAGYFFITLSLHAIVTDFCKYKLFIWEGNDEFE
ncbi:hypothetical protein SAMN05660242_2452 [Thermoanaerobacterium sp. RBIITD]|nr:hypothetical protein SAMN05660242_2452 [Thermoanaerobacterium sp. RBIITD]